MSRDEGGSATRAHLERAAASGSPSAIAMLAEEPEKPDALGYLWDWWTELDLEREYDGMGGRSAITYGRVTGWAVATDRSVLPHEAYALVLIDRVYRVASTPEPRKEKK